MIRRIIIAVTLLGAALLVLHLTIGFENFASEDVDRDGQPIREREEDPLGGSGVVVGGVPGNTDAAISVSGRGRFEYSRTVAREFDNGEVRYLPRYSVVAENSETVAADLLRLIGVEVRFYRIEDHPDSAAIHVGTVTAREALVQVGRDDQGSPSVLEDRDMDLYGVRLVSTAEAQFRGLRLEVDRLAVRQTEDGTRFETPRADEPFHVELGGARPAQLDGHGIAGFVPSRSAIDGQLELHVRSRPILTRHDLVLSAEGPLDYVEDLRTGAGRINTSQNVEVRGFGLGGVGGDTVATGEQLTATLVRYGGSSLQGSRRAAWARLVLQGNQASLLANAIELTCDVLSVSPSLDGAPALFTATGEPAVVDRRTRTTFRAAERIHLIDVPSWLGSMHRDSGFGTPLLPEIAGQLVVFEGASRVVDSERGLEITASDGLRVLRSAAPEGPLMAVGAGEVHVASAELAVDGQRGFELRQSPTGQVLRLGPLWPNAEHVYTIEHRAGDTPLRVTGSGSCQLVRETEGGARVALVSTRDDIQLKRGEDILDGVRTLSASVDGGGALHDVVAEGARCHVVANSATGGDRVEGHAARIESPDGRSFVLTGSLDQPAELTRGPRDSLSAPAIELHPVADARAWLVARGEGGRARVRVHGQDATGRVAADDVELVANLVVLAPALLPSIVRRFHGVPALSSIAAEHVLAQGRVALVERAPETDEEITRADGDAFVLAVRSSRGELRGTPASIENQLSDGRRVVGRADRVQFAATPGGRGALQLVQSERFDPELDLRDAPGEGSGPLRDVRLSCTGDIEARPEGASFGGPVHAQGLTADGEVNPESLDVRAGTLAIDWDQDTRELRSVEAGGQPTVRIRGVAARGDRVLIDAPSTTMTVFSGPEVLATVELDQWRWTGAMFRVDYESRTVQAWQPDVRGAELSLADG